jgi:ribonuclease Z
MVEIYGPSGIREFVRSTLRLTKTHSLLKIKINELLIKSKDQIFTPSLNDPTGPGRLWHNEVLGQDIWSDQNGLWKDIIQINHCGVSVSAAPIQHTSTPSPSLSFDPLVQLKLVSSLAKLTV